MQIVSSSNKSLSNESEIKERVDANNMKATDSINFIWIKNINSKIVIPDGIDTLHEWKKLNPDLKLNLWIRGTLISKADKEQIDQLLKTHKVTIIDFDELIDSKDHTIAKKIFTMLDDYALLAKKNNQQSLSLMEQVDFIKLYLGCFLPEKPYVVSDFDIVPFDISTLPFSNNGVLHANDENYFLGFNKGTNQFRADLVKKISQKLLNLKDYEVNCFTGRKNLACLDPFSFELWKGAIRPIPALTFPSSAYLFEKIHHLGKSSWRRE